MTTFFSWETEKCNYYSFIGQITIFYKICFDPDVFSLDKKSLMETVAVTGASSYVGSVLV
jgi:hypothetical protein